MRNGRFALVACGALLVGAACQPEDAIHKVSWFNAMVHQRSIRPYAMPRDPVEGTVPITGVFPDGDLATADHLVNPRTRTSESVNRGKLLYETYCLVCHGASGRGDGPISSASGGPFFGVRSVVTDTVAKKTDGYIYGVIVNAPMMGRGLMPHYGDKVRGLDRWDLVNYIRTLQAMTRQPSAQGGEGAAQ
ncbi:MAG TPA: cytochrome c [Gemmatimonadales bacterium]|nr:cytochrome c [Gemmatimonadales bacterium]